MKKRIISWLMLLVLITALSGCGKGKEENQVGSKNKELYNKAVTQLQKAELKLDGSNEMSENLAVAIQNEEFTEPKNFIFMIGDGMGYNITEAAQIYYKDRLYKETLSMYHMPVQGTQTTYSMSNQITDSAAGGTALATACKTANRVVGKSLDKTKDFTSTLELAAKKGKSTGVVVTTPVVDATPADFTVHVNDREEYNKIAAQQLAKFKEGSLQLALGGGQKYYECDENKGLLDEVVAGDVSYTKTWEDTKNASLPVIGLYAEEELDTLDENMPSLAAMTDYALSQLSKDEDGFFLMVEGAQIDDFAEHNNLERELGEVYNFDCAIAVAMRFVALNPDTVLIITADHETGDVDFPKNMKQDEVLAKTTYSTDKHTCKSVPVLAAGYRTEELLGTHENTDVGKFVASLLGEKDMGGNSEKVDVCDFSESPEKIEFDGKKALYEIPLKDLQEKTKDVKAIKILHVTLENNTDKVQKLPSFTFVYKNKPVIVKPQKSYVKAGETIQVDYTIPENGWNKRFVKSISKPSLTLEGEEATYLIKDIHITTRKGLK